jgi:hypothetical protein
MAKRCERKKLGDAIRDQKMEQQIGELALNGIMVAMFRGFDVTWKSGSEPGRRRMAAWTASTGAADKVVHPVTAPMQVARPIDKQRQGILPGLRSGFDPPPVLFHK